MTLQAIILSSREFLRFYNLLQSNTILIIARFIQYCMDNGSYKGCAFQMPDIDDENLATQLAYLDLESEGAHCGDKGLLTSTDFEDQEWKPGEE